MLKATEALVEALESQGYLIIRKRDQITMERTLEIAESEYAALHAEYQDLLQRHQDLLSLYKHLVAKRVVSA